MKTEGLSAVRAKKILYFSCHEILEYDDLRLLTGLGHKVFSIGDFTYPGKPTRFRPSRPEFYQEDMVYYFHNTGCEHDSKKVSRDFAQSFDLIILNQHSVWMQENYDAFQGVPIVMRTIGQSRINDERLYSQFGNGIYLLRYSEAERNLPGFAKTDGVIYFAKHDDEFVNYQGGLVGLTFHNAYCGRSDISYPNLEDWKEISKSTPISLYGAWNDAIEFSSGLADPRQVPSLLSNAAFYQYVYTTPPSYTLSLIESLMAGLPVIAPSERYIRSKMERENNGWWPDRYEVPSILADGAGVVFDTVEQAQNAARRLAASRDLQMHMSERALASSERFNAKNIAPQWQELIAQMTS